MLAVLLCPVVDFADGRGDRCEDGVEVLLLGDEGGELLFYELPVFVLGAGSLVVAAGEAVFDESDEQREDEDGTVDDGADGEDRDDGPVVVGWWPQDEPHQQERDGA